MRIMKRNTIMSNEEIEKEVMKFTTHYYRVCVVLKNDVRIEGLMETTYEYSLCGDIMNSHELCRVISEDRKSVTWIPYSNIQYIVRSREEYDGESIQGSEAVHNQAED